MKGLYFVGDVKTATKRYPVQAITSATSDESGAWATYSSKLKLGGDKEMPIYCVSHRRGDAVHKFVATCGTTLRGKSTLAYFEDEEERYNVECADFELARKSPSVLNDFTIAQPTIDRHNRYRQHLLAMEKRFQTNTFAFRFFTSMLGFVVVNAFMAHRYFNNSITDFLPEIDKLGCSLMANNKPASPSSGSSSPNGSVGCGSPNFCIPVPDYESHQLVLLRSIPGYKEATMGLKNHGSQQRCVWCNHLTSWACISCSSSVQGLVPLCPRESVARAGEKKGQTIAHVCFAKHCEQPGFYPKGKLTQRCKRARSVPQP